VRSEPLVPTTSQILPRASGAEHETTSAALKTSVGHAIAAGELLIEAKALLKHGQWLPWLADHCAISDRTAQLYMRCAKNSSAIEANTQCVADLTLNEAAAILMLKRAESADPDELINLCAAEGIAVIRGKPFGAKEWSELEDSEQLEWYLWTLFGVKEFRVSAEEAFYHTERLQSRDWSLTAWYGDEGDRYRKCCGLEEISQSGKDAWGAFLDSNRDRTIDDVQAEIIQLDKTRPTGARSARRRGVAK